MNKIQFEIEQRGLAPKKMHKNDAGFDLYLSLPKGRILALAPNEQEILDIGVRVAIPEGYMGLITVRSSLAILGLYVVLGIIDSGYTDTIKVIVRNLSDSNFIMEHGSRFAQLIIIPICTMQYEVVSHINRDTERGENGLGSTGEK